MTEKITNQKKTKSKSIISLMIIIIGVPVMVLAGALFLNDRKYNIVSVIIAILACVPFFISFENGQTKLRRVIVIAVMSAISVAGRSLFAVTPGFKPVTAITVITAMSFGPEAGFLTGAVSAIVSNMFFGQGPWTPFQMFTWGIIGFLAGIFAKWGLMKNRIFLSLYGIFAGVLFSLIMDIWTVMSIDGTFEFSRYLAAFSLSLPFTAIYAVSNVIFLLLLARPIGDKLERLKVKYDI